MRYAGLVGVLLFLTSCASNEGRIVQPDPSKPGFGPNFPNTNDYWPATLRNLERGGTSAINVCVGEDGKLATEPTVVKTSGNQQLDEAAIAVAKAGTYVPAIKDGVPTRACFDYRVKFGN